MKDFDKYRTRGADYHYKQINRSSIKDYNASVEARFQTLVSQVADLLESQQAKVLDVGCGDGVALHLLEKRLPNLELFGVEPVSAALEAARKHLPRATLKEGFSDSLPFPDEYFEIVISSDVIEHVDDPDKMLQEISRVAKKDAIIIVGTPIRHSKTPLDHNHVQEFFAEDFKLMMDKYFRDVQLHESHELALTLMYNAPTRFKYLINLLSLVFGWNPFKKERRNKVQMFSYMYVTCKK